MSLVDSTGKEIVAAPPYPVAAAHNSLEVMRWQAMVDFDNARVSMAPELPTITKEGRIQLKPGLKPIPFVRFEDLHAAVMPTLFKFGFYATFQGVEKNGDFWAQAFLRRGGCSVMSEWPVDRKPVNNAMNPNQAAAAGFSLACRHALIRLLNLRSLAPEDADTDAIVIAQEKVKVITAKQVKELEALIAGDETLMARIKHYFFGELDITELKQFPAAQFGALKKKIETYNARKAEVVAK